MTILPIRLSAVFLTTAVVCAVAACGGKEEKKVATQVAAKVGSEEISVHQINQVLSRANTSGVTPETAQKMGREVLEKLIDQELAVEQAIENKLQRSPEVVAQIEAARREILARAYMQQITSAIPKPTELETKKYFTDHPQLFSERRVYNIQEIVLPNSPGLIEQLRPLAAAGKPMEDTAALLKSKGVQFGGGAATRAAEQIPLEILPRIHALKDGQSTLIETPQNLTLLRVVSSQSAPIAMEAALPRIEQFLTNQRAGEAVTANIKQLRSNTKITYMGEFSKPDETGSATASPQSTIEKGIAGLK